MRLGRRNTNMPKMSNALYIFRQCRKDCFILEKLLGLWDRWMQITCVCLYLCSKNMDLWINKRVINAPSFLFTKILVDTNVFYIPLLFTLSNTRLCCFFLWHPVRGTRVGPYCHRILCPHWSQRAVRMGHPPAFSSCPAVVCPSLRVVSGCQCPNQNDVLEIESLRNQ